MQQPVNNKVDRHRQYSNSGRWQKWRDIVVVNQRGIVPHHRTPVSSGWLNAKTQKTQGGNKEKHKTKNEVRIQPGAVP